MARRSLFLAGCQYTCVSGDKEGSLCGYLHFLITCSLCCLVSPRQALKGLLQTNISVVVLTTVNIISIVLSSESITHGFVSALYLSRSGEK